MPQSEKWDFRFLRMAREYASWSKDPSTQVGAVIVDPATRRILSGGYNGFPRGIDDSDERLLDRATKYSMIVHAEMNAIYNATYSGTSLRGATLYTVGLPTCSKCALGVIQVGIARVVCVLSGNERDTWLSEWETSKKLFEEAEVSYHVYDMILV